MEIGNIFDSNPVLLFVDVNLGGNKKANIAIREFDKPEILAKNFSRANGLDQDVEKYLVDLLSSYKEKFLLKHNRNLKKLL
jgi:hypothetical protein